MFYRILQGSLLIEVLVGLWSDNRFKKDEVVRTHFKRSFIQEDFTRVLFHKGTYTATIFMKDIPTENFENVLFL